MIHRNCTTSHRAGCSTHLVASRVAVVGTRERRDTQPIVLDRVPVLADLVRTDDRGHLIQLAPTPGDVWAEPEANAALGWSATRHLLGVGPKKLRSASTKSSSTYLAHQSLLSGLAAVTVDSRDLLQLHAVLADGWTTVHDEVALVAVWSEDGWLGALRLQARWGQTSRHQCGEGNYGQLRPPLRTHGQ